MPKQLLTVRIDEIAHKYIARKANTSKYIEELIVKDMAESQVPFIAGSVKRHILQDKDLIEELAFRVAKINK